MLEAIHAEVSLMHRDPLLFLFSSLPFIPLLSILFTRLFAPLFTELSFLLLLWPSTVCRGGG